MFSNERINLVAPCGIDCGICELNMCKDNKQLLDYLVSKGIPKEKLPCEGCRSAQGICPVISCKCETYKCFIDKKIDFCYECKEFPCEKLNPSADRAETLPHNLKVFNLCTIKRTGVKGFIETSSEIKQKYYKGKMQIGNGPQI
ncbi:MAG: DUF3795 domain-containing protein [Deltaproteobacteria bacterium]